MSVVQVCKKRKSFNGKSPKEPNSGSHKLNGGGKSYKHIKLMPLNIIKQVIDIKETEGKLKCKYLRYSLLTLCD